MLSRSTVAHVRSRESAPACGAVTPARVPRATRRAKKSEPTPDRPVRVPTPVWAVAPYRLWLPRAASLGYRTLRGAFSLTLLSVTLRTAPSPYPYTLVSLARPPNHTGHSTQHTAHTHTRTRTVHLYVYVTAGDASRGFLSTSRVRGLTRSVASCSSCCCSSCCSS